MKNRDHIDIPSRRVKYLTRLSAIPQIPAAEREKLADVEKKFVFRVTDYYLELIDWDDPNDPIKQLIVPREEELNAWGTLDASNEAAVTVAKGVQHKYADTCLLLCNEVCGAYCRYCFRKRLFMNDNDEVSLDVSEGLEYIAAHPEINNVLLTGGDPLMMSPKKLLSIIERVSDIPHVRIIRLGTKMPAFNPYVILDRPELIEGLERLSRADARIHLMAHFDHPRELTAPAREAMHRLIRAGVICVNQCPLIKGVNDNAAVLAELYSELSFMGVSPYYLFQGRPTEGNEAHEVPITRGFALFEEARKELSGLAARIRMCMSHDTGKVEIVGMDEETIYCRYHRSRDAADAGRFMTFRRDDEAYWIDQLEPFGEGLSAESEVA